MLPTVLDTGSEIRVETLSQSVARVFLHSSVPCGFSTLCWGCSTWRYANEGKYKRFSWHFCLCSGGHTETPTTAPPQRRCLHSAWVWGWALAASSLPQPGLDRTTQEVISGQLCGFLHHKGGSRCPRHPKYHFGNQPRDRKSNKVEIAPAASRN